MLSLLGIIAIVIFAIHTFRSANSNGRNGGLWAFISVAVGIALQWVVPLVASMVIAIFYIASGSNIDTIEQDIMWPAVVISFAGLGLSFLGMWLVLRHVSQIPDEEPLTASGPPPPPVFGDSLSFRAEEPHEVAPRPKPEGADLPPNRD
ncbi:MAG TPA: hypothetical protein DEP46_18335 [Blastocatellia bacterium]|nr:hypothetical protein [Blastocatellia bacterium]